MQPTPAPTLDVSDLQGIDSLLRADIQPLVTALQETAQRAIGFEAESRQQEVAKTIREFETLLAELRACVDTLGCWKQPEAA